MQFRQVLTKRAFLYSPSMQIVHEWEDVLSQVLEVGLVDDFHTTSFPLCVLRRLFPFVAQMTTTKVDSFAFELLAWRDPGHNTTSITPCVIDFFIRGARDLRRFYRAYRHNPVVLISSREVFDFLQANRCPLNIRHWPLSIPDKWIPDGPVTGKRYDVAVMGRENPVLLDYLDRYLKANPHVSSLRRERTSEGFAYRSSVDGTVYPGDSREDYMRVMRLARVGLYATPGMDGAKPEANGFNQVTPRFLEFLACGCRVIARYADNSDTRFYELPELAPSVETYEEFARQMDEALSGAIPFDRTIRYLRRHATSARAHELKELLSYA